MYMYSLQNFKPLTVFHSRSYGHFPVGNIRIGYTLLGNSCMRQQAEPNAFWDPALDLIFDVVQRHQHAPPRKIPNPLLKIWSTSLTTPKPAQEYIQCTTCE